MSSRIIWRLTIYSTAAAAVIVGLISVYRTVWPTGRGAQQTKIARHDRAAPSAVSWPVQPSTASQESRPKPDVPRRSSPFQSIAARSPKPSLSEPAAARPPEPGLAESGAARPQEEAIAEPANEPPAAPNTLVKALDAECRRVNEALAREDTTQHSREDLLAMYGRSSVASGQFALAAAAYAMFLDEYGMDHPYSEQIAERLATSLAPLDLDSVDVLHTAEGPRYQPSWRMGYAASAEHLRLAIGVYEWLAGTTKQEEVRGKALLAQGWVYRALNEWNLSTKAWERCAAEAPHTRAAADALWYASENLSWQGRSAEASERLQRLVTDYPEERRGAAAPDQIEVLEAESRRTPVWLKSPVESLEAEIQARAGVRKPHEVYASVVNWLQRKRETTALLAVCRWACEQTDWPIAARVACRFDLADALLRLPDAGSASKLEAAAVLGTVAEITPKSDWMFDAGLRRARLLKELGRFEDALDTLRRLSEHCQGDVQWEPSVLLEWVITLLDQGDKRRAGEVFERLRESYPTYEVPPELAQGLAAPKERVP